MNYIHTNNEEKQKFGKVLTKLLSKKYPFVLDVEVEQAYIQGSKFDLDCLIVVSKEFIIENIKLNCSTGLISSREIADSMNRNLMATYMFNDCSKKGLKFNTEDFIRLSNTLFRTLFGGDSEFYTYSIMFKMI